MTQRKKNHCWGLIAEGFRQCRTVGILFLVIMILGAVAVPVMEYINAGTMDSINVGNAEKVSTTIICSYPSSHPLLLLAVFAAPLMTLILFHFLDNRAASDLYHALPHKRITLYVCYVVSVLLWVLILLFGSMLVSLIVCKLIPGTIIYDGMVSYVLAVFLAALLLMSGLLVTMSLTGTVFTNVLLAGIILFLPRFCCRVLTSAVSSTMPFLMQSSESNNFFRNTNNLLYSWASVLMNFEDVSVEQALHPGWQALLYTFLLAVLYLAIGSWLFCHRRSEAAGQAAPSRMLQHVYRILVTMAFTIFVTSALYNALELKTIREEWFIYVLFYVAAVLIYCIYELITTRRWKNLWKAMPGLVIVAVLNGAILLGLHTAHSKIMADRPAVQEIESVSFRNSYDHAGSGSYLYYTDYVGQNTQNIKITDPTAISLISYYFNENVKCFEEDPDSYYEKYQQIPYDYGNAMLGGAMTERMEDQSYDCYIVTIRTKKKAMDRQVYIPVKESKKLMEILKKDANYVEAWKTLPDPLDDTMTMNSYNGVELSDADVAEIFASYREEIQQASFDQLYSTMNSSDYYIADNITYSFYEKGRTYTLTCPIYDNITPKTANLYYEKVYAAQAESREIYDQVVQGKLDAAVDFTIYSGQNTTNAEIQNRYLYGSFATEESQEDQKALQQVQKYLKDAPVISGESYAVIWISPASQDGQTIEETISITIPVDEQVFLDSSLQQYFNYDSYLE